MDSNISEKDFNLNKLKSSDFNGHTDFKKLTPHQKLEWLSAMVQFYYKYSRSRKKEWVNYDAVFIFSILKIRNLCRETKFALFSEENKKMQMYPVKILDGRFRIFVEIS